MSNWLASNQYFLGTSLIHALLVLSVFLVLQAGLLSLAGTGFMALGGYSVGILTTSYGWSLWAALPVAMLVPAAVSVVLLPILKLRGTALALATLSLAQLINLILYNSSTVGGQVGIIGIPAVVGLLEVFIVLAAVACLFQFLQRSHYSRSFRALRLDERTAAGLGINSFAMAGTAFVLSGALAGLAGGLDAGHAGFVSTEGYSFTLLVAVLVFAVIGGYGHWLGCVIATVVGEVALQALYASGTNLHHAIYGIAVILVVILVPNGLSDPAWIRRLASGPTILTRRRRRNDMASVPPGPATSTADPGGSSVEASEDRNDPSNRNRREGTIQR